jgi:hypothetical protein
MSSLSKAKKGVDFMDAVISRNVTFVHGINLPGRSVLNAEKF